MKNGLIFFMGLLVGIILTAFAAAGLGIAYYSDSTAESEADSEVLEEKGDSVAQSEVQEEEADSITDSETEDIRQRTFRIISETMEEMAESVTESEAVEQDAESVAESEEEEKASEPVAESETVEEKGDSEVKEEKDTGITYAEEWTEFTVARKFKVVEVLEDGALAKCETPNPNRSISGIELPPIFTGPEVYIMTSGKNLFYDDQIVEVPAGQKAMQIGTWRFRKYSSEKVVPIIVFK